ncbi:MAG: hypothetical protein A2882_15315 [Phenylobacterium sp. RIFCSPHIGHO2_01_FULL_70_10]|nr:MAG: hypothetical protein A2882_15315 [Phenylobacterium sp. RIFCSPHIGHO2_01_FULL_70_10]
MIQVAARLQLPAPRHDGAAGEGQQIEAFVDEVEDQVRRPVRHQPLQPLLGEVVGQRPVLVAGQPVRRVLLGREVFDRGCEQAGQAGARDIEEVRRRLIAQRPEVARDAASDDGDPRHALSSRTESDVIGHITAGVRALRTGTGLALRPDVPERAAPLT